MSKTVIIGGVAGGATAAARLRRLDESMEIVVLERGDYISYANCGLPYYIGDVIKERPALLLQTPEAMKSKFNIDVRINNEVTAIHREEKTVTVRRKDGSTYEEAYDDLVIATGSSPLRPRIPGIDSEGIYTLWTVNDTDRIRTLVDEKKPARAAVIGGGFIGLEMAENLHRRGIRVAVVEAQNQVMAPLDPEMAQLLHGNMIHNGISLYLGDGVQSFEKLGDTLKITLASGACLYADMVILSIGVRPNSALAKEAGLALNARGGIVVDDMQRTSFPDIWAVGDVVEITNAATGEKGMIPLAGPANKQGRIAADNIAAKHHPELAALAETYKGSLGTSIAQVFDFSVGSVGVNEKVLKSLGKVKGTDYETILISQKSHAGYYPMATAMYIKLIFGLDGKIFGAQVVGQDGVDKRTDTIAAAMRLKGTVRDLEELELAYAPPYSSAKDPVNMAGFCADNLLKGLVRFRSPLEIGEIPSDRLLVLDVREDIERAVWYVPGSYHIPLGQLRERCGELPKDREICVCCAIGVRAHNGSRILQGNGFKNVSVLEGGAGFYRAVTEVDLEKRDTSFASEHIVLLEAPEEEEAPASCGCGDGAPAGEIRNIDCSGLQCPGPIMKVSEMLKTLKDGDILKVSATDMGFARDVESWCARTGNTFLSSAKKGMQYIVELKKGIAEEAKEAGEEKDEGTGLTPAQLARLKKEILGDLPQGKTIIVFDGDYDKALASFIIANGAAAMGRPVTMFFTFWGLNILRKSSKVKVDKTIVEKMFGAMMPQGTTKLTLSKMNMAGTGTKMMKMVMKQKNVSTLEDLIRSAMDAGVRIVACTMSMDVMGIKKEELIDGIEYAGVASYLGDAELSNVNLFI